MHWANSRLVCACCCYMEWPGSCRAVGIFDLLFAHVSHHSFCSELQLCSHQAGESQGICLRRAAPAPALPASAAGEFETHIKSNKREIIEVELEKSPKEVIVPDGSRFFPSVNYCCLSLCIGTLLPWSEKDKISPLILLSPCCCAFPIHKAFKYFTKMAASSSCLRE